MPSLHRFQFIFLLAITGCLLKCTMGFTLNHKSSMYTKRSVGARISTSKLSMGTIAVFGGTGLLGRECVAKSLDLGYKTVVLARDPSKMLVPKGSGGNLADTLMVDDRLKVIEGDVTNQAMVDAVFSSCTDMEGVVVSLGGKTRLNGPTMLEDGTRCIVQAMKRFSPATKRISVVTAVGCGDSESQAPLFYKALMWTVMASIYKDKNKQEQLFLDPNGVGHELEYCIIRPGGLGTGPPSGVINVMEGKTGSIHRADVASFALGAVTDPNFKFIRKTPCISSVGGTSWMKEPGKGFDGINTA